MEERRSSGPADTGGGERGDPALTVKGLGLMAKSLGLIG